MFKKLITNCLDLLFPKSCLSCHKEGVYLCDDCIACLEISKYQYCLCKKPNLFLGKCHQCRKKKLDALYFALPYQKPFVKKLIRSFKYSPFIKDLSQPLASLIIEHFYLLNKQPNFSSFILIPIPLNIKKLKWRGFNQAEEIARELSKFLNLPIYSKCLIKTKETIPQIKLNDEERKVSLKNAFSINNPNLIKDKKILLIDDVYTTGSTMEEAARILKKAGAKEVIGVTVARG